MKTRREAIASDVSDPSHTKYKHINQNGNMTPFQTSLLCWLYNARSFTIEKPLEDAHDALEPDISVQHMHHNPPRRQLAVTCVQHSEHWSAFLYLKPTSQAVSNETAQRFLLHMLQIVRRPFRMVRLISVLGRWHRRTGCGKLTLHGYNSPIALGRSSREVATQADVVDGPRKLCGCCCIDKGKAGPFWDHAKYKKTATLIGRSQWWARIM